MNRYWDPSFALMRVNEEVQKRVTSVLKPFSLSPTCFYALDYLSTGEYSQQMIGDALGMSRNTMVTLLDKLESLGVCQREVNKANRREHVIRLTRLGEDVLPTCRRLLEAEYANLAYIFAAIKPATDSLDCGDSPRATDSAISESVGTF